ncbi:radical SAM protein [Aureimonas pseudogalii]|uniref:Radical SAM protein with 4Fe4S-binding SPASM domain n=1 Tax=Aureimonas pseudogalii TaxID=1744844 RepID=A0A7W6EBT3_9HYPH|nr:radical SAM protein [Aureimonas pseudogalii]MBB3997136.1 radical SAM protein with 4Fe4S-binding SPASM domain [Aureimonas pseudogalii]
MVAPLVGTYGGTRPSPLTIALFELGTDADPDVLPDLEHATPLARATREGDTLLDNMPLTLSFPPIADSAGRLFAIQVSSADEAVGAPTVWLSDADERTAGHRRCFVGTEPQGAFGAHAQIGYAPKLSRDPVPRHLLYSPITQCNLNCVHCISRDTRKTVSRLADGIKNEIAAWAGKGWIRSITTDYSGDILWAEARYGGELDFLFALDVPLSIDTNGAYLTPEVSRRLMDSRLTTLNVSLDTPDPETYKWIRKGAPPLPAVIENVRALIAARDEAGARGRVRLSLSFTIMRSTLDQWDDFIRLAADLGIEVVWSRHLEVYTGDLDAQSLWHDQARHNAAQAKAQALAADLGVQLFMQGPFETVAAAPGKRWCDAPWTSAVILGNGDVQVCCMPKTKIGNLNETPMEELWAGPRYQAFRGAVNSVAPPTVCQVCPMFRQPNNEDSYFPYRRLADAKAPVEWAL